MQPCSTCAKKVGCPLTKTRLNRQVPLLAGVIPVDDVMELQHRYGEGNLRLHDEELSLTATDKAYRLIQRFQTLQAEEQSAV